MNKLLDALKNIKMITITFPVGDALAQYLIHGHVDLYRVFYMGLIGALTGLIFYVYYPYVDGRFNNSFANTKKILTTEFLFVPIYYIFMFVMLAIFQGKIFNFVQYLEETFFITYLGGQLFWLTVNLINFNLFNEKQRLKVMSVAYVPWGLYLSLIAHLDIQGKLINHLGDYIYLKLPYIMLIEGFSLVGLYFIFRKKMKKYRLALLTGGLQGDPDFHIDVNTIKTVKANSLREAKQKWAEKTGHNNEDWDKKNQTYWGWTVKEV